MCSSGRTGQNLSDSKFCDTAKRRYDELTEKGVSCDLAEIEKDIIDRDYRDMHRETSPLRQAEDAVLVDSSEMNIDEVVDAIYQVYSEAK